MTPEWEQQVDELYHAALGLEPGQRAAFLAQACGGNEELRREVEQLLAAHEQAGDFLNTPAVAATELLDEEPAASLVGRQISHYRVLSPLGKGGMGEVYLAQDLRLDRRVALKLLPAQFTKDADRVRRFEREARAASALNHPNIITIYEIGQADGLHYIATEFIEGETLRPHIMRGRLAVPEALEVAAQAASALQAAHTAGIVHRDIKPENIMLRPDGYIKVLDFGLAKLIEQRPASPSVDSEASTFVPAGTAPGTILGTVAYMSPEQARGLDVDARSDLWSLGVVLYEMITGRAPFKGATATDVIVSIISHDVPPLSHSLSPLPPELERIVTTALAKDRKERYQTANDLAIDLRKLKQQLELEAALARTVLVEPASQDGEPLPAHQPATNEQVAWPTGAPGPQVEPGKRPAFYRPLIAAAAVLAIAAIGFIAWSALRSKAPAPAPPPAPERALSYSITVQRMRDGKPYEEPFQASGRELFESGYKFRIDLFSPQSGFLYLLNEGPVAGGAISYRMVFPIPSINGGSAQLAANERTQTGWYLFDENPGMEKFWIIWAARPVNELEAVKGVVNAKEKGLISDPTQLNAVREFLAKHAQAKPEVASDKIKKQTDVRGRGEVLVNLIELEHH